MLEELLLWALHTLPGAFASQGSSASEKGVGHKHETTSGRKWWEENETVLSEEGKTGGGLLGRGEAGVGGREEGLFFGCRIRPGLWTHCRAELIIRELWE